MAPLETNNNPTIPAMLDYPKDPSSPGPRRYLIFDDQLKSAEGRMRKKLTAALESVPESSLPSWLTRLLSGEIVPALERIGFDPVLSWALFNMAVPAWERMGPIGPKTIYFHPELMRELADIREGYLHVARENSEKRLLLAAMNSRDRVALVGNSMDPGNLFHLLENIATSWIILPRAFGHLDEKHARWLPGYLECLEKEGRSAFANILMRIIIEFVGNFALKFSRPDYPRQGIRETLFYGYAAMFWKNLRNPLKGVEDAMIFENFLRWIQNYCKRCLPASADETRALAIMEKTRLKATAAGPSTV